MTSRLSSYNFELFFAPRFEMRLSLARLVKTEIMSPYHGILINTRVGNPTVPFTQRWEQANFKANGGAFDIHRPYKEIRFLLLPPRFPLASPSSSSNAQVLIQTSTQPCPDPEREASG